MKYLLILIVLASCSSVKKIEKRECDLITIDGTLEQFCMDDLEPVTEDDINLGMK